MRARKSACFALALAAVAVAAHAVPNPPGPELRINTGYESKQKLPAAAFDRGGVSVVVWSHDRDGLLARFYTPSGQPQGRELLLVANQNLPSVPGEGEVVVHREPAALVGPGGDLFLFWTEERAYLRAEIFWQDRQILERAVFGQRFAVPSGRPAGEPFRISGRSAGLNARPAVALHGERLLVVWHSQARDDGGAELNAIFGRFLDRAGNRLGAQFRLDTRAGVAPLFPAAAFNAAGEALVAWEGCCEISRKEVYGRVLDAAGAPIGEDFRINTNTRNWQRRPAVAAGQDGNFLVAWQGSLVSAGEGRIFGQFVGPRGDLVERELMLSTADETKDHGHLSPALARTPAGGFMLFWIEWHGATPQAVYANELSAAGAPITERIRLSTGRVMLHERLGLASDGRGGFLAAWEGVHERRLGISARRLGVQ
jgi:hypothetical protein